MNSSLGKRIALAFSLLAFFALIIFVNLPFSDEEEFSQLGAEYGHIAESIVNGKGYANVFAEDSGPTVWMLPLTTWIFAGVFSLFGIKTLTAKWALLILNSLFWTASAFFLVRICSLSPFRRYSLLSLPVFLLIIFMNPNNSLGDIMDVSLVNLLSVCCVYFLYTFMYHNKNRASLFILAVVLPLSSPGLFLAFSLAIAAYCAHKIYQIFKRERRSASSLFSAASSSPRLVIALAVGFTGLLTLTAWGIRNYAVMNSFIPSKSNLWYEFYQANVLDDDGVLDKRTLQLYHPNNNGKFLRLYLELGELKFVNYFKHLTQNNFDADDFRQRVFNRLKFSFFYNPNISIYLPADVAHFTETDLLKLEEQALVLDNKWISLHLQEGQFATIIKQLKLDDPALVWSDWELNRSRYQKSINRTLPLLRSFIVPILPIICILIGLAVRPIRRSGIFQLSLLTYGALLLPYVLISAYNRYLFFSQSLQVIFVFLVLGYFIETLKKEKERESKPIEYEKELFRINRT